MIRAVEFPRRGEAGTRVGLKERARMIRIVGFPRRTSAVCSAAGAAAGPAAGTRRGGESGSLACEGEARRRRTGERYRPGTSCGGGSSR